MSWYLDSSAILKLIFDERETEDLRDFVTSAPFTSRISRVEVARSVYRRDVNLVETATNKLSYLQITELNQYVLGIAESFPAEITLKTLDAIHVATAYFLGSLIEGIITYDKQMALNARRLGIAVASPGR